jgi:hypothetical protein
MDFAIKKIPNPHFQGTDAEKDLDSGTMCFVSFPSLLKHLPTVVRLREGEEIVGFVVTHDGLKVKLAFKK